MTCRGRPIASRCACWGGLLIPLANLMPTALSGCVAAPMAVGAVGQPAPGFESSAPQRQVQQRAFGESTRFVLCDLDCLPPSRTTLGAAVQPLPAASPPMPPEDRTP